MKKRQLGILLLITAAIILAGVGYRNSQKRDIPLVFSSKAMLGELWNTYKTSTLEPGTFRTLDKQQENITTSEGESYTMLRSVWQDDKTTFDESYTWLQDNMNRKDDQLYSWKFGKRADGSYGILTDEDGQNTASDADSDIALSLILANSRWGEPKYMDRAKLIITDIWKNEVVMVNGKPVMTADNLEKDSPTDIVVNPSYFSPYSYRLFAKIDPTDDWNGLINNTYSLIDQLSSSSINTGSSDGLPPDWVTLNRQTGAITASSNSALTTNYSYDAMRLPWRLALDYQWFKSPADKTALAKFSFLAKEWDDRHLIYTTYSHDGKVVTSQEAPAIYGGDLGYFIVEDPSTAKEIYETKLKTLYSPNTQSWQQALGYYDDNWAWFGIALYNNALPNLTVGL